MWYSDDLAQGEPDLVTDQVVVEVLRPQLNPHEVLLDPLGQVLALAVRVETLQRFSRVTSPHKFLSRARQDLRDKRFYLRLKDQPSSVSELSVHPLEGSFQAFVSEVEVHPLGG